MCLFITVSRVCLQCFSSVFCSGYVVVVLLFIVTPIVGVCNCVMLGCMLLYVHSSFVITLGMRELVAMLSLSSWCLVIVVWLSQCHGFVCSL